MLKFIRNNIERVVLVSFHNFALTRAFVVDATQMQHTVHDNPVKLAPIRFADSLGISAYSVERYKHIAAYHLATRGVEGDYVGIIIVIEETAVNVDNLGIIAKDIRQLADYPAVVLGHLDNPALDKSKVEPGHINATGKPLK